VERFQALHADASALAVDFRPLDVGVFAYPVDRIVMCAKQAA